ncbi:dienelactone hydrolase family protein [soil metagenome]
MSGELAGWESSTFTSGGITHDVYRRGEGPAVVVVHEIPGITPTVLGFAEAVVDAGFTVVMPLLVGSAGREPSLAYTAISMLKVCISREFTTWALDRTSPVVSWLRALARSVHADVGGPGVGVVGMCFSGGFALGMMVDPVMVAPVLSQPSLPLAIGTAARSADLNLTPDDREVVAHRAAEGCQVLGLRFTGDKLVGGRFDSLRELLGDAFIAVELPSTGKRDHSVLTEQRDDASVSRVIEFLREKLLA